MGEKLNTTLEKEFGEEYYIHSDENGFIATPKDVVNDFIETLKGNKKLLKVKEVFGDE